LFIAPSEHFPFSSFYISKGAALGLTISTIINIWIGFGSVLYGKAPESKVFSSLCNGTNSSDTIFVANVTAPVHSLRIYELSYLWFSPLAIINTFAFGLLGTLLANCLKLSQKKSLSANLTIDVVKNIKSLFKCGKSDDYSLVNLNETFGQTNPNKTSM
jgi:hypothetical protein